MAELGPIERYNRQLVTIAEAARDLCYTPEFWESYQDMQDSNSMDIPVEFMALCDAVVDVYGPFVPNDSD